MVMCGLLSTYQRRWPAAPFWVPWRPDRYPGHPRKAPDQGATKYRTVLPQPKRDVNVG